ncbi:MAG: DUF4230 domain-containing protein [Clostridiales bacterium]|nr:DUF4230 domain-containing protein [Clostridiales bacterium]
MKKFFLILFTLVLVAAVVLVAIFFGPSESKARWLSASFSETLKEKNELIVYSGERTGRDTYQRNALLIGTVQEVEIPYTFNFDYTVDLSQATVEASGTTIYVRVPAPVLSNHKLTVVDKDVERTGALVYISPEKYTEIKQSLENKLLEDTLANEEYTANAWEITVRNLTNLLTSVARANAAFGGFTIEVVQTDAVLPLIDTQAD